MNYDLKYVIFDYVEIDIIDFEEVQETSIDTLRISNDGLKTFVKWFGNTPNCVNQLTTKSVIYNNDEMLEILKGDNWSFNNQYSGTTE